MKRWTAEVAWSGMETLTVEAENEDDAMEAVYDQASPHEADFKEGMTVVILEEEEP